MRVVLAVLTLLLVIAPASPSLALDCTPFQTFNCTNNGYYDYINGQPGEIVCGVDFTGWTLHVVDVTITTAGVYGMSAAAGTGAFGVVLDTAILLMDDCNAGTCVDMALPSGGVTDFITCLDVGTHKFVVAVHGTGSADIVNMGLTCVSCADAIAAGISCVHCDPVGVETSDWSSLKGRFED